MRRRLTLFEAAVGQKRASASGSRSIRTAFNRFADVTVDHQFIHVDPEAAKATPFGTTIPTAF